MKVVLVVAVLAVLAVAVTAAVEPLPISTERALFDAWTIQHKKTYMSVDEESQRFGVFRANLQKIREHNASGDSWTMGANQFMDMTADEFKSMISRPMKHTPSASVFEYTGGPLADGVDWRTKGTVVTPVKDQGQCGSCWAFSTIAAAEGMYAIAHGNAYDPSTCGSNGFCGFSEQQLVDCSTSQGNMGCNGGLMDYGFTYLESYAIDSEKDYPYTASDGSCKPKNPGFGPFVKGYTDVKPKDANALKAAVMNQPISVAIEADTSCFQFYSGGILSKKCRCGTNLDHGVTLVGYTDQAWIVKNSWGKSWGDSGYIQISNTDDSGNLCGILQSASFPK